jgi:TolB protein
MTPSRTNSLGLVKHLASVECLAQQGEARRLPGSKTEAVWSMSTDGSNLQQLTPTSMFGGIPDWSPDGRTIVFENNACTGCPNSDIFFMDPNGKHITQLTSNFGNNTNAEWSPDGTKIVFEHGATESSNNDIYVMNADGTGLTNLTGNLLADKIFPDWGVLPTN